LNDLREELKKQKLTAQEIEDILKDHEEMIQTAIDEGLQEEELANKFGDPSKIAAELAELGGQEETKKGASDAYETWKSFDGEDTLDVRVEVVDEDIHYKPSENGKINVLYRGEGTLGQYELSYENKVLRLKAPKRSGFLSFLSRNKNTLDFIIEIPENVKITSVYQKSVNGDIRVDQMKTASFELSTVNGDALITKSSLGHTKWNGVNGDLNVTDVKMKSLKFSLVNGDLSVSRCEVEESLNVHTVSGDAKITDTTCGECGFHSVSGDITGEEFYPKKVSLKSVSGDILIKNKEDRGIEVARKKSVSGTVDIRIKNQT